MTGFNDEPLTYEESMRLVHSNINEWTKSLERINTTVKQWREYLEKHRQNEARDSVSGPSRTRSDSLQSINEESHHFSKPTHIRFEDTRARTRPSLVRKPSETREIVFFDANSQKLLEELVKSFQSVRSRILRALAANDLAATSRAVKARKADPKTLSATLGSSSTASQTIGEEVDPLDKQVRRLEYLLKCSMDACEEAAYQLLRKGACDAQMQNITRRLKECWGLVKPQKAEMSPPRSLSTRSGSSPSRSMTQPTTATTPVVLEVDDDDEDSGNEGELDAQFDALRLKSKQMASRVHGSG
ncbi:Hypothetical protein D9617_3g018840 [Elsinoe fawcettii]|nr:Hypothetical protein D9617_3g018840 [Elsinoe fawcettii]